MSMKYNFNYISHSFKFNQTDMNIKTPQYTSGPLFTKEPRGMRLSTNPEPHGVCGDPHSEDSGTALKWTLFHLGPSPARWTSHRAIP